MSAGAVSSVLSVREADLRAPADAAAVVELVNAYASDPVGGGVPLPPDVRARLVPGLRAHPTSLVLLAFEGDRPIGIAVCFFGFSTFQAGPLLNVHDLAVLEAWRGRGVGRVLLDAIEERALSRGCVKLTLEVQDENIRARRAYERFGFADFTLAGSVTRFLTKPLVARN